MKMKTFSYSKKLISSKMFSTKNPVLIDYKDLSNKNTNIFKEISEAYGPDGLGIALIKNVPNYSKYRNNLLPMARKLSEFPPEIFRKYEKPEAFYSVGLTSGDKYKYKDKVDQTISFWGNPINDNPDSQFYTKDGKVIKTTAHPNVWPKEDLPELEPAFKNLGRLIFDTGCLLAYHLDKFMKNYNPNYEEGRITKVIRNPNGRLIHYTPSKSEQDADEEDWVFWHCDWSEITGLTSPIYMDANHNLLKIKDNEDTGLEIVIRDGSCVKISIPEDCIAFQTGECLQIHTGGRLIATPHRVLRGKAMKGKGITRETFVVFFNPAYDEKMTIPTGAQRDDVFVVKTDKIAPLNIRWKGNETYKEFNDTTWGYYTN